MSNANSKRKRKAAPTKEPDSPSGYVKIGLVLSLIGLALGLTLSPYAGIILGLCGYSLGWQGKKLTKPKIAKAAYILGALSIAIGVITWFLSFFGFTS